MLFGRSPSYCVIGGAGRSWGRLPAGATNGVAVGIGAVVGTAVAAEGTPGVAGAGEFLPPGVGLGVLRGGGSEAVPTWANSSLNIQTFWKPGDTPVQVTPGALSSEPTPISV